MRSFLDKAREEKCLVTLNLEGGHCYKDVVIKYVNRSSGKVECIYLGRKLYINSEKTVAVLFGKKHNIKI